MANPNTGTVAKILLSEVPLAQIKSAINHSRTAVANAMGDGCGGGCGGGAGCLDQSGLSGLTNEQIASALRDPALDGAVATQIGKFSF